MPESLIGVRNVLKSTVRTGAEQCYTVREIIGREKYIGANANV
jgi:hypothetical protein